MPGWLHSTAQNKTETERIVLRTETWLLPNTEKFRLLENWLAQKPGSNNCSNKPSQASQVQVQVRLAKNVRICRKHWQWSILNASLLASTITIWRLTGRMRNCCCRQLVAMQSGVKRRSCPPLARLYNNLLSQKDLALCSQLASQPARLTLNMFAYFSSGARSLIPRRPISRMFEQLLDEKISLLVRRLM